MDKVKLKYGKKEVKIEISTKKDIDDYIKKHKITNLISVELV